MEKVKQIKDSEMYSPQNYTMAITGKCYMYGTEDDAVQIERDLEANGYGNLRHYPFQDIDEIIEDNANVVLVDACYFDKNDILRHDYRWFEVPDDFKPETPPIWRKSHKKKTKKMMNV